MEVNLMRTQQSTASDLEAVRSPSNEIEAFRSNTNFDYNECVRRLALLVESRDSKTLEETAFLLGRLTTAIE
jgi:hypothetical protein